MNDCESIGMNEGSKMPHSHSTPAGVDGGSRTPPTTPRKAGKMLAIRVQMLDDTVTMFQIQAKALGKVLFDQVCKQLHLLEADYFGLEYQEPHGAKYWLDLEKPVCRQVGFSLVDPILKFCVKFYTPDPAQLEEEFTRYLFCLQIKRDLAYGLLQCNDNTAALMASYIVQAECGDYVIEDYPDHTYLSTYKFVPHQDHELERRIMENHKKHAGQSPAEADLNLLETARRCELYGMKMHAAKDHEGVPLNLAVAHMGIVVFQNYTKINVFSWAKIRKISFKRKRFLIKLHPEGCSYYKDPVEFFFDGRNECKNFWKKCVENHGFFRCSIVKRAVRQKTRVLSRGSSFRYSGKTQKQIVEFVRDNYVKRQTFHRSNSFRQTSSGRALQGVEGGGYRGATSSSSLLGSSSISAHPLLPLGDPALGTPALSLSCGSMTLDSPTTATSVSVGGTSHRREDTVTSFRTLTSIDVHSPATPNLVQAQRPSHVTSQQRISSTGRISPSNSSPSEFPQPRPLPRYPWQRSASCRDLYASSFEGTSKARLREEKSSDELGAIPIKLPSHGESDYPVTRYDEKNRSYSAASSKLPSLDHDYVMERVYSSSYPGTSSLSTESGHEESTPAGDLSHDDLSHDSYELLEREHECEYLESYSSPRDDEIMSDNSDEGIEPEMFHMDTEIDSFVKHKSIKTDKHNAKSGDTKSSKNKYSSDRNFNVTKSEEDFVVRESRMQRSSTQIERRFETRHSNSVEMHKVILQDVSKKQDPVILQVQRQKVTVLNELKSYKPKYKMTHVDSEVLRDEGIMRPKSRIDDDLSPSKTKEGLSQSGTKVRTARAKSIASLEDHAPRQLVQTGSLGRSHKSRDKKSNDADAKVEKMSTKSQEKDRRVHGRDERKRVDRENSRESRRKSIDKSDSRDRGSVERSNSKDYREISLPERTIEARELCRSIERIDLVERDYENIDFSTSDFRSKNEQFGLRELRKSLENLSCRSSSEKSRRHETRERRRRSFDQLEAHETQPSKLEHSYRHTFERSDYEKPPKQARRKSVDRLDARERSIFDFDQKSVQYPSSFTYDRRDSKDRSHDKRSDYRSYERTSLDRLDSRERKSIDRVESSERRSFEYLDRQTAELRKSEGSRRFSGRVKSEEKAPERDDWRSLEKARRSSERRDREYLTRLSLDSRSDSLMSEKEGQKGKTVFSEYCPKVVGSVVLGFDDSAVSTIHTPVERARSDPNPGRQRLGSNNKRHMLTHQKSIDLTPADSGDEDPFSEGATTPKSNADIPYILHKRHIMNGTASDEKSESDNGKVAKAAKALDNDLPQLPLKPVTEISCFDLSKISLIKSFGDKPKSILISPDKPKSILSPSDTPKGIPSPTSKLSPTGHKTFSSNLSPSNKSPSKSTVKTHAQISPKSSSLDPVKTKVSSLVRSASLDKTNKLKSMEPSVTIITTDKKSLKLSPIHTAVTVISAIEKKKKSSDSSQRSPTSKSPASKSPISKSPISKSPTSKSPTLKSPTTSGMSCTKNKVPFNFADVVGMEIKQELERREKERLQVPIDSLEKQDSIEKIPLPEVPFETSPKIVSPVKVKDKETSQVLEKPSIPEKTKRILDKIESRFSEISKKSSTKVSRPKVIDTGYDDFVDPVADLPLDDVPVKPILELDTLQVPEFNSFIFRPHTESFRSKSLSLAEEKAPIDTLLSPELENKQFLNVSPKKSKKSKTESKKDFQKQSKSLEGDKPPLKKSGSKELRTSPSSSRIDKSKLKLNEMPQEIIVIDSTDAEPEVSIIQKGRSKSIARISFDRSFSKDEKDESKTPKAKSASIDDEMIKGAISTDRQRPKTLGISKSLGSSDKKDSVDKVSPKKRTSVKGVPKADTMKTESSKFDFATTVVQLKEVLQSANAMKSPESKSEMKSGSTLDESRLATKDEKEESTKEIRKLDVAADKAEAKQTTTEKKELKKSIINQEMPEPPVVLRKPGQSSVLFARARLGLSEGSGIGALQRQGATQSPTSQRRAKSLDAPVISLHRLPPANAFSSKDDTVDMSEEAENKEPFPIDNVNFNQGFQVQPIQTATSPNHKADSIDRTTVPEVFSDSLSVTETSTQYLESPLTENNEIVPDLIPYEQEVKLQSTTEGTIKEPTVSNFMRIFARAKFIDQSSVESGTDQDIPKVKNVETAEVGSSSIVSEASHKKEEEHATGTTVFPDEEKDAASTDKNEMPNVTVSITENYSDVVDTFNQPEIEMIKSPIQISIEECSDNEMEHSEEEEFDQETFHVEIDEKRDNSEDTLDSLDTQVQMQGVDSERSSPDYLGDKTDEKTLVEVELTAEYLEMKKEEDVEMAENLPEDEPMQKELLDTLDTNRLDIDKKLRLSAERSRSDETSTYTPDRDDPDSSSCSIARPLGIGQIQTISDSREIAQMKMIRKESSAEDESSSCAPRPELSSTWRSFPLESSGSSSLEEGWMPQDEASSQQIYTDESNDGDSYQEGAADFPGGFGFHVGPEILANYGAFSLSRTLSRISERSTTSEQDKSELDDSFKPSSRSPSLDDESLISSDHQPSLSSDPPSGAAFPSVSEDRRTSSELPDIPIDVAGPSADDGKSPKTRRARLQLQTSEDWPSPPSSPLFDATPVISHVETFYMDIRPEEATRVTVTDSTETTTGRADHDSDSDEENRTLHDDLHSTFLEEPSSASAVTTIEGTGQMAVKPKSNFTGSSHSEDTSMGLSMSEWSSSNNTVRQFCQYSGTKSDDNSLTELGASISDWSGSTTVVPQQYMATSTVTTQKSQNDTSVSEKSAESLKILRSQASIRRGDSLEEVKMEEEVRQKPSAKEDEFVEARKFIENQFGEDQGAQALPSTGTGLPPPLPEVDFEDEDEDLPEKDYDVLPDIPDIIDFPRPIPEEDEDQYDHVPDMRYSSGEQAYTQVSRGNSSEEMHERYASSLTVRTRSGEEDLSFEEQKSEEATLRLDRPQSRQFQRHGTRSTERPVVMPIRTKSSSYYSTTSMSGESTTSSPPMPIRVQIRTKTMPYSSGKSPQSEGDTSSSMDSPGHTPDRGQRAFRRKRVQNAKRRHRVVVDLEIKDGQIVSSTDSSFDVSTLPPPLLPEQSLDDVEIEDDDYDDLSESTAGKQSQQRH